MNRCYTRCFNRIDICVLPALVLALATTTLGQEIRGTILGRILDESKATVPGSKVTITNQATNVASR
jgi:hypothetical protein